MLSSNSLLLSSPKLISRIDLSRPSLRKTDNLSTNFAKYSPLSPLNSRRPPLPRKMLPNQRFKKHSNLVETNKENMMRLGTQATRAPRKKKDQEGDVVDIQTPFGPKRQRDISHRTIPFDSQPTAIEVTSANLQGLLRKNSMKSSRNLLGLNILSLERKFNFSRFELHSLYIAYKALLLDSGKSMLRFRQSLEVMLSMDKVTIRPDVLDKVLREQKGVSFQDFIGMYKRIQQVIYKQSIIDYVQSLFDSVYDKGRIRFEDITRILENRITEKEAHDIATIIYEQNGKRFDERVALDGILEMCHCCENFEKKMYRLYTREVKLE